MLNNSRRQNQENPIQDATEKNFFMTCEVQGGKESLAQYLEPKFGLLLNSSTETELGQV